jgi:DNA-binding LytR/AlgR family response regulator
MKPRPTHPPLNYFIIDDNEVDRMMIEALAASFPSLNCAGSYAHPLEALEAIRVLKPQLLFLDIEMPDATGIELLKVVRDIVPMAVFITSFPDFALDGFELSALDYILKPLSEERFSQTISRVQEYWEMKQKSLAYDVIIGNEVITIKQGHDQLRLPINDIIYLEALNDYTKLITEKKSFVTIGALSNFMEQLPERHFYRIHRSYAVALNKVSLMRKNELVCGTHTLPIGKTYRSSIAQMKL